MIKLIYAHWLKTKRSPLRLAILEYINSICKNSGHNLIVEKKDSSNIQVGKHSLLSALQNIVTNSTENSKINTKIFLSFENTESHYIISVKDQGTGFSPYELIKATEKHYSSKQDTYSHGLGLYIVNNFMDNNNGTLKLENIYCDNKAIGAKINLIFNK